jgi:hypothetical protein
VALLLVSVGAIGRFGLPDELARAGAGDLDVAHADSTPQAVDGVLERRGDRRLVIEADLAGLNLLLARLMRRNELHTAETAVVPRQPIRYLTTAGLPNERSGQVEIAVHGRPRLVGVIKDDSGGLCVDGATMTPWEPAGTWWLRAVVDDSRLADGNARSLSVRRRGPSELEATVRLGRLRRRTQPGRSLQLACDEAQIVTDGVPRERPRSKRTFWSEPELWRLALPEHTTQ